MDKPFLFFFFLALYLLYGYYLSMCKYECSDTFLKLIALLHVYTQMHTHINHLKYYMLHTNLKYKNFACVLQ